MSAAKRPQHVVVAAVLICGALACRRSAVSRARAAVEVAAIEVKAQGWRTAGAAPSPGELRAWIAAALPREGVLAEGAGRAAEALVYQLRVEVGLVALSAEEDAGADDPPALGLGVRARATPRAAGRGPILQSNLAVRLPAGHGGGARALREVTRRAVEGSVQELRLRAELLVGSEQRLLAALKEQRSDRLTDAIDTAAWRRSRAAVPRLIALLRHDHEAIADRAIGALAAIGDRSAVPALTRLARFEDTARLAKLLDAVGALGGDEARRYLAFVARGHPDPDLATMAREALARMR
ncbi:MAG: HEAT repeat domain-containing protein [Proteobacteria bacterium]|nr:HEAT repeat domain-containing protein [Pseudomonadota bacterium]